MARPPRSAGAGGSGGKGDFANLGDQPRGVDALAPEIEVAVITGVGRAVQSPGRHPLPRRGPQRLDMIMVLGARLDQQTRRLAEAGAQGGGKRSGADAAFLAAAMKQGFEG